MKSQKKLAICAVIAGLAVLVVVVLFAVLITTMRQFDFEPMPFEAEAWRNSPAEFSHDSIRLRMVDDLLDKHPLIGNTEAEVVALIGEPDETGVFSSYDMVYQLGQERSGFVAIDCEWLVIKLDSASVVIEAKLLAD